MTSIRNTRWVHLKGHQKSVGCIGSLRSTVPESNASSVRSLWFKRVLRHTDITRHAPLPGRSMLPSQHSRTDRQMARADFQKYRTLFPSHMTPCRKCSGTLQVKAACVKGSLHNSTCSDTYLVLRSQKNFQLITNHM